MPIPGYRIIRRICQGGMATVYLAEQESVGREVALKILSPALLQDPNFSQRFLREARFVARLVHPNIVSLFDLGEHEGELYIAMEYLPGTTLRERIRQGMDLPEALRVLRQVASALACSHREGIIHRDVKPDNVLFRSDGTAVLTDFGIATVRDNGMTMTQMGLAVGTPNYMSPEQAQGRKVDHRADIYSLGVLLHEMLTGAVPFTGEDPISIGIQHLTAPIPRLPAAHQLAQPLLQRLMAKAPEARFQSAEAVISAIETLETALLHGSARVSGRHVAAMLGALGATARAWVAQQLQQPLTASRRRSAPAPTQQNPSTPEGAQAAPAGASLLRWVAPGLTAGVALGIGAAWWLQPGPAAAPAPAPITATAEAPLPQALALPPPTVPAETSAVPAPPGFALQILATPESARIRLPGIKEKYSPGMKLAPGRYDVEVSARGYVSQRLQVEISDRDVTQEVSLESLAKRYPPGSEFTDKAAVPTPRMVVIPGRDRAQPAFAMSKYEITFAEFNAYARQKGIRPAFSPGAGMERWPAAGITWQQAQGYVRWLSERTGHSYRLPSGSEWQRAAQGSGGRYWWGNEMRPGQANCRFGCGDSLKKLFKTSTREVGSYAANSFGLHDTAGNVAEWTTDCFYEDRSGQRCSVRTLRGGAFSDNAAALATAQRSAGHVDEVLPGAGLRVLRELD